MRTSIAAALVLFAGLPALGAEEDPAAEVREARTLEELLPLVRDLETRLPEGRDALAPLKVAAKALARFDRVDDAAAFLLRHRERVGPDSEPALRGVVVDLYDDAGRPDEAIAAARAAAEAAEADEKLGNYTERVRLARLLEKKGDFTAALDSWHAAVVRSFCGTCADSMEGRKAVGILRCRFRLGETEAALAGFEELLAEDDAVFGGSAEGFPLYFELAAEAGRLERAKRWFAERSERIRAGWASALEMASAFEDGEPGRIVEAVDLRRNAPGVEELAARLLGKLGDVATDEMERRIVAGDTIAIHLARIGDRADLLPALSSRLALEPTRGGLRNQLEATIEILSR